jgi:hypothetical protein
MSSNKNTARQNQRRAKKHERNLEAFERGDAEIKPLDEAARSGLFRFLNAAQKYAARRKPGFVEYEKPNIVMVINDET